MFQQLQIPRGPSELGDQFLCTTGVQQVLLQQVGMN